MPCGQYVRKKCSLFLSSSGQTKIFPYLFGIVADIKYYYILYYIIKGFNILEVLPIYQESINTNIQKLLLHYQTVMEQ
jgi:hypothetical protein